SRVQSLDAQSITNKLGAGGVFTIKDGTTNFFTLRQSDGWVGIGTTSPNGPFEVARLIRFDASGDNTILGYDALLSNVGSNNTATGWRAMYANTGGESNTAFGSVALYYNISGKACTGVGVGALYSNLGSYNTGIGKYTLYYTTSSDYNVAVGYNAGGLW